MNRLLSSLDGTWKTQAPTCSGSYDLRASTGLPLRAWSNSASCAARLGHNNVVDDIIMLFICSPRNLPQMRASDRVMNSYRLRPSEAVPPKCCFQDEVADWLRTGCKSQVSKRARQRHMRGRDEKCLSSQHHPTALKAPQKLCLRHSRAVLPAKEAYDF